MAGEIRIDPEATVERIGLDDTSWVDVSRRWLVGLDALFDHLMSQVRWHRRRHSCSGTSGMSRSGG